MVNAVKLALEGAPPVRTKDRFLVFGRPALGEEEISALAEAIRSGWPGTGPRTQELEDAFARYVGANHAVAVSSCTAALHLAMIVSGVRPGDEVITTPLTFVATANAIEHTGASPVFVDIDRGTQNIDPEGVARALRPETKAIVPVDFAGRPIDYPVILSLAEGSGVPVIEDAAHCIEGRYGPYKSGSAAHATCFSFYVTKNITTVEGGMITTNDERWARDMRVHALHGLTADAWSRYSDAGFKHYDVIAPGYKYNMTDLHAVIGLNQLAHIDEWHQRREELWARYEEAFRDLPIIESAPLEPTMTHARHLYTILLDLGRLRAGRDQVLDALHAEGIGCGVHYTALHLLSYYRRVYGLRADDFPNATFVSERTLSIPLSPALSDEDAADVIEAVRRVLIAYRG
jgi:dTDP-4-amino-4,6-dideoxygalactose transaminase